MQPWRLGIVGKFAQAPPGERLVEFLRSRAGRRDDERFVVSADQAGTVTRPLRVQAGQAQLVEPVDHSPDRILVAWTNRHCRPAHPDPSLVAGEYVELEAHGRRCRQGHAPALLPQHRRPVGAAAEDVAAFDLEAIDGEGGGVEAVD